MNRAEIDEKWKELEVQRSKTGGYLQQMVCIDLLYRVYIGVTGIPTKRFISIELPISSQNEINDYKAPQGFDIIISQPNVKNEGFFSCTLQSSSADQNDVFTIVAEDILTELYSFNDSDKYIITLKNRIEKWRQFFKSIMINKLSEEAQLGLFGELTVLNELYDKGICFIPEMWNGPIKAAQDFQNDKVAIEVKTISSNSIQSVIISSEDQLDLSDRSAIFLVVNRVERNDNDGISLPELIEIIKSKLSYHQRTRFMACLLCLGYREEDADLYYKKYSLKETMIWEVENEFPRLCRTNIPSGISKVKYRLTLSGCDSFKIEYSKMVGILKE